MIIQPNEMQFEDKKFSMIIAGAPGVGKTTLALSAPKPILIDLDKGISRVKAQHRKAAIVVENYEELLKDLEAIKDYETIVIDTGGSLVTLLQDWAMRKNPAVNQTKGGDISIKGFGAVKQEFIRLVGQLTTILNKNVIFIFHTVEEKNKDGLQIQRLMCEGAARNIVWQPCDLGCNVYMQGYDRKAGFTPTDEYFAKGCYGISGVRPIPTLAETAKNDYITRLFEEAKNSIQKEGEFFNKQKEAYDSVMEEARKLVESIKDADTANKTTEQFKNLKHVLTSEIEVRAMVKEKIEELKLTYDKEAKAYVQKTPKAEDKPKEGE
jgi:hypothetical protein